jgi:large subunit ribosomal protein L13
MLKNLWVYKGPEHPHSAQQPQPIDIAALHKANRVRGNKNNKPA